MQRINRQQWHRVDKHFSSGGIQMKTPCSTWKIFPEHITSFFGKVFMKRPYPKDSDGTNLQPRSFLAIRVLQKVWSMQQMLKSRTSKAWVTPLRRVTRRDWWLGVFRQSNTGWSASSIDKSWIHESLFTVCGTAANTCGALSEPKQHCSLRTHPFLLWAKTQMIVAMWILWPTTRMTRIYLRSHLIMRTKPSPRNCGYNLVL